MGALPRTVFISESASSLVLLYESMLSAFAWYRIKLMSDHPANAEIVERSFLKWGAFFVTRILELLKPDAYKAARRLGPHALWKMYLEMRWLPENYELTLMNTLEELEQQSAILYRRS